MGATLSKQEICHLASHTKFTEAEIEERHASFRKKFPTGKIDKEQFQKVYAEIFADNWGRDGLERGDTLWRHIFRACDQDNSGFVDFKEFILAVDGLLYGDPSKKLDWMFKLYDINNSGGVNERELATIVQAIHEFEIDRNPQKQKAMNDFLKKTKKIFDRMDKDKDQQVDKKEFLRLCLKDEDIYQFLVNER